MIVSNRGDEYCPYGRPSDRRDSRNRYRFIGVERDEETGMCMTGPRLYDPVSGRFLQGDPLATKMPRWVPFAYSKANPVRMADRNGLAPEEADAEPWVSKRDDPLGRTKKEQRASAAEGAQAASEILGRLDVALQGFAPEGGISDTDVDLIHLAESAVMDAAANGRVQVVTEEQMARAGTRGAQASYDEGTDIIWILRSADVGNLVHEGAHKQVRDEGPSSPLATSLKAGSPPDHPSVLYSGFAQLAKELGPTELGIKAQHIVDGQAPSEGTIRQEVWDHVAWRANTIGGLAVKGVTGVPYSIGTANMIKADIRESILAGRQLSTELPREMW